MHGRNTFYIAIENTHILDSVLVIWSYTSYYFSEPRYPHYKLGNTSIPLQSCIQVQKDEIYKSALWIVKLS